MLGRRAASDSLMLGLVVGFVLGVVVGVFFVVGAVNR